LVAARAAGTLPAMSTVNAYGVIMAGGSGTRFWPLSRAARPKQFLPLGSTGESLLAATVRRLERLVPAERILVVVAESLVEETRRLVPQVSAAHVLAEPVGRNTAPCVGWAASVVAREDPEAVLGVFPADHHISDEAAFAETAARAIGAAAGGALVTIGIRPTRPETGYGYIEIGEEIGRGVHRARRFVEKPDAARAAEFLADGRFLWNSGMFFFRADAVLREIAAQLPELAAGLARFDAAAARSAERAEVKATFADLPSVSIDHGVMERAAEVLVLPGDFGWSDVGGWTTVWELAPHDERGNAFFGEVTAIDASNCYVRAPAGKLVAVVGLDDVVVVDTEDALLVLPKSRSQDVREIVEKLKRDKRARSL
jgi:mannose-1-phosphate guanylyltransferase